MNREGQVWEGPLLGSKLNMHLVLERCAVENEEMEAYITLDLATGVKSRLLMIRIDNDEN